jgi:hypothetical protein
VIFCLSWIATGLAFTCINAYLHTTNADFQFQNYWCFGGRCYSKPHSFGNVQLFALSFLLTFFGLASFLHSSHTALASTSLHSTMMKFFTLCDDSLCFAPINGTATTTMAGSELQPAVWGFDNVNERARYRQRTFIFQSYHFGIGSCYIWL